jgi:hypothetical protein
LTKLWGYRRKRESNAIGDKAEELFNIALIELKAEGRISWFKKKDFNKVDFLLSAEGVRDLKIQVKSSWCWTIYHSLERPDIPVVRVKCRLDMTPKNIRKVVKNTKLNILEIIDDARHHRCCN